MPFAIVESTISRTHVADARVVMAELAISANIKAGTIRIEAEDCRVVPGAGGHEPALKRKVEQPNVKSICSDFHMIIDPIKSEGQASFARGKIRAIFQHAM